MARHLPRRAARRFAQIDGEEMEYVNTRAEERARVARATAFNAENEAARERRERAWSAGRNMKPENTHVAAINEAKTEMANAIVALNELDAQRESLPDAFYQKERLTLTNAMRRADEGAMRSLAIWQGEQLASARSLRVEAEAKRDPAQRMADELEYRRLVDDASVSSASLVEQAKQALLANNPRSKKDRDLALRADLLLRAAAAKSGAKPMGLGELRRFADEDLDVVIDERREAAAVEKDVQEQSASFVRDRLQTFAKYGLGIDRRGLVGTGQPGQVATASLTAKVAKWQADPSGYQTTEDDLPKGGVVAPHHAR